MAMPAAMSPSTWSIPRNNGAERTGPEPKQQLLDHGIGGEPLGPNVMRGIQCIPGDVAARSKPDPRHRDEMKGEKDTDCVVPPAV